MIAPLVFALIARQEPTVPVRIKIAPAVITDPVGTDADDPAVWSNGDKSLIIGTDKAAAPLGGLYVFNLDGKIVQHIENLDRPNNVDVVHNFRTLEGFFDLVVVTERNKNRLRIFKLTKDRPTLVDVTGDTPVVDAPMGVGLYRHSGGLVDAIITPKDGPLDNHLAQYRLEFNLQTHKVDTHLLRRFGKFSGKKETESVVVDSQRGIVYYSDERFGNRAYYADPKKGNDEIALFNTSGTQGDHEGMALWGSRILCTDQIPGESVYRLYSADKKLIGEILGADETDGIDTYDKPLGGRFLEGILVVMNSQGKNFWIYDLQAIRQALGLTREELH